MDALVNAGQLEAGRDQMRKVLKARIQVFGQHLVVSKTMIKLAKLELRLKEVCTLFFVQNFWNIDAVISTNIIGVGILFSLIQCRVPTV